MRTFARFSITYRKGTVAQDPGAYLRQDPDVDLRRVNFDYGSLLFVFLMLALGIEKKFGTRNQRHRFLPRLASGRLCGDNGIDLMSIRMTARRKGDDDVVDGTELAARTTPKALSSPAR